MAAAKKSIPDTKRIIFEAALSLFTEKGYERTTMDDIIAAAQVSKGSIYWHFKSKKELFSELYDFWCESIFSDFEKLANSGLKPVDKLRALIDLTLVQWIEGRLEHVEVFLEFVNMGLKDDQFRERLLGLYRASSDNLEQLIKEGIETADFGVHDARRCADSIISFLDGMMLRSLLDPSFRTQENLDFIVLFIMRSLEYRELQG